ncbi:GIY-YIG nuclease family protein [Massilia sp. CT11-108]|uniref:GIY-YIG nuclease family protein n=1 Tax=Massilia sp. CT11-108 TaxID=3393900 RepID=UPI0039A67EC4
MVGTCHFRHRGLNHGQIKLRLYVGERLERNTLRWRDKRPRKRVWQHREGLAEGFTKRYRVKMLVWYEIHADIMEAIRREKQIKKWDRSWKVELIQKTNPRWRDLYADIVG